MQIRFRVCRDSVSPRDCFRRDMEAKSTTRATAPRWKAQIQIFAHDTVVWKLCGSGCGRRVPTFITSHTLTTHCRSGPPHPAQLCVVHLLTNPLTHSRAYVVLAAWPARARPLCLVLAQLALSSPQLACTPPLQLGTRLIRVALDHQRLNAKK